MPTSSMTGITREGSMPAAAVYTRELADRDGDTSHSPVADAQDLLGVGGDDQVDVVGPGTEVVKRLVDSVDIVDAQVDSARALELLAVSLNGRAHRGRVHDGDHLGEVVAEKAVVERLVAIVQSTEEDVLAEVVDLAPVLCVRPLCLQLDVRHCAREETTEPELAPLLQRER